jgi:flagellar assembly protein FliH
MHDQESTKELTQDTYRPTQYADTSWPVVGDFINQDFFEPSEFPVVERSNVVTDPMFADYGGGSDTTVTKRLHAANGQQQYAANKKGRPMSEEDVAEEINAALARQAEEFQQQLEQAKAQAFEEGRLSTMEEADTRMQAVEQRYAVVLEDIGTQLNESLRGVERQAVDLAIMISEKLVGQIVEVNPEYLIGIVREGIRLSGGAVIQNIRVSPEDYEFIKLLNLPKQFKDYDGTWEFIADETIRAGCIVTTAAGEVDYQVDKAWERVKEQVIKVL